MGINDRVSDFKGGLESLEPRLLLTATFTDVSTPSGLAAALTAAQTYCHGAAWGDVNGDGYPDLFYGSFPDGSSPFEPNRLMINDGDGTFTESVQASINNNTARTSGAVFADFDNDGDMDLIVMNNWRSGVGKDGHNQLLRNDGPAAAPVYVQFTDVTAGSGIDPGAMASRNAFPLDADGDGDLDVILQSDTFAGQSPYRVTYLMRNDGNLQFTDVTGAAGFPTSDKGLVGIGGAVGDVNGDGWPDFLSIGPNPSDYDESMNRLYLNDGDGTFTLHINNGVFDMHVYQDAAGGDNWPAGAAFGDLDNDGDMDIVIGQHFESALDGAERGKIRVYLNNGGASPSFTDVTDAVGIVACWIKQPHVEIQDFDNDGYMDIMTSATMKDSNAGNAQMPVIFRNRLGDDAYLNFELPSGMNPASFPGYPSTFDPSYVWLDPRYFPGAPTADYNLDGKMDIFGEEVWVKYGFDSPLFQNTTSNSNNYLDVRINTTTPGLNRNGIGAVVKVYQAGHSGDVDYLVGMLPLDVGNGFVSGREAIAHFGLGGLTSVDVVAVMPSGGPVYSASNVAANQVFTLPFVDLPPTVDATVVNRGAEQRSRIMELAFTFSEPVTVVKGDLTLYDHSTSSYVNLAAAGFAYASNTATWDLSAVALNNAYHTATLLAANITDAGANHLDGDGNGTGGDDYTYLFHKLGGDANGNASTNVGDLAILGAHYGESGNWWQLPGDMNANGDVNVGDLGILGVDYGTSLTPPGGGGGGLMVPAAAAEPEPAPSQPAGDAAGAEQAGVNAPAGPMDGRSAGAEPGQAAAVETAGPLAVADVLVPAAGVDSAARLATTISADAADDGAAPDGLVDVLGSSPLYVPLEL